MSSAKLRWLIAGTLLLSTTINYADRVTLSVLIPSIEKDLHLNSVDYAQIVSVFLFSYAAMYAVSGYLVDRWGPRRSLTVFSLVWSVSQMLHAFARGKLSLAGARFSLGAAEPGNFPAAVSAIREWFPVEQRALGIGVFNAGSSLGAALAPPLAGLVALRFGWRAAFLVTGGLGLAWLGLWRFVYHSVDTHPWLSTKDRKRAHCVAEIEPPIKINWLALLQNPACLLLMLSRFLTDPVIYFVIFWLPTYLSTSRGFDLAMIARYAWMPYIFGDVGYIFGGWLSGEMIRRGWTVAAARRFAFCLGAAMLPAAIFAPHARTIDQLIAAMCVVVLGHSIWVANILPLPADIFDQQSVGTVSGLAGMAGSVGGILTTLAIGYLSMQASYNGVFMVAGLLHPLAAVLLAIFLTQRYFPRLLRDPLAP